MADEFDEIGAKAFGPDALAARIALNAASADEAREYLRRQNEIALLQIENLRKQDEYETSHLRWRRFNDQMRGALQIMGVLVGLLIVVAIGTALWSASQADGLVIEAPSVPPALAEKGLTGPVLAAKLLDRLAAMQEATDSARAPSSFRNDWTNDIRVQIADTGISIGQIISYLHNALGHERHLTGELTETSAGLALTLRLGNAPGDTVTGQPADLDGLIQRAAETVFYRAQPYRYARYIQLHGNRMEESLAILRELARSPDHIERDWALSGITFGLSVEGKFALALDAARRGRAFDPENMLMDRPFAQIDVELGHAEAELADNHLSALHAKTATGSGFKPELLPVIQAESEEQVAELLGDYQQAARLDEQLAEMPDYQGSVDDASRLLAQDFACLHDLARARAALISVAPDDFGSLDFTEGILALQQQDWHGVADRMKRSEERFQESQKQALGVGVVGADLGYYHRATTGPFLAYAAAKLGEAAEADRLLRGLPADCYACVRAHAQVAAIEGRYDAASWWFARADRLAPSLPFAATDWGEMLLARGDFDGAIARFELAHERGPHFPDPLEMWGEALMQKNRSDLAIAKFEEANKYAPHWARLHLEWGKALLYVGRKDEAQRQFALAQHG